MCAQCMRDRMHKSEVGIREAEAGDDAAEHHLLAGVHIRPVGDGLRKIVIEYLQPCQRIVLGERRRHIGNIALDGVSDRIHARCGRDARRHRLCEFRIRDDVGRDDVVVDDHIFDDLLCIDQGADIGDLARCAGRGRNRDEREAGIFDHIHPAVLADPAGICHEHIDCFGQVDTAASAYGDKALDSFFLRDGGGIFHHFICRIRDHPVKDHVLYPGSFHLGNDLSGYSRCLYTAVIHDHDFFQSVSFQDIRKLFGSAAPKNDVALYKKVKAHILSFSFSSFFVTVQLPRHFGCFGLRSASAGAEQLPFSFVNRPHPATLVL